MPNIDGPYQQALDIKINDKGDFNTFEVGKNQGTVSILKHAVETEQNEFFYLFGPHGSGKTHLLNALFLIKGAPACLYLDLNNVKQIGSAILNVPLPKITILDNVEAIKGDDNLELALFGLFNRWYDKREGTLIISGSQSFDTISFNKKDINTRLSSGVICQLNYLDEEECVRALELRAKGRSLILANATISFLVRHCNHDMNSLIKILDLLEKAQLEQNHELTIPFVKKVLNIDTSK